MTVRHYVEIVLSIPDNEARTALAVLQRLGLGVTELERVDVYRFDVDASEAGTLTERLRSIETIFNPSKHIMRERTSAGPGPGELWVEEAFPASAGTVPRFAGRVLRGVSGFGRLTSWRMRGRGGEAADERLVAEAARTLLCNAAFQKGTAA